MNLSSAFSANEHIAEEHQQQMVMAMMELDEEELQTRKAIKLAFCIGYGLLFLLGTFGNGLVIVMICNVLCTMSRNKPKCGSSGKLLAQVSAQHVFIYVLGLSIVDLFVILHLPLLIFEMSEGQWLFGEFMCKMYWFGESVNKLLSSFLMTVLSWDRFMAVCSPINSIRMRTNSVAYTVLACCTFFATLLLYPVLKESTVIRVNKLTGLRMMDDQPDPDQQQQEEHIRTQNSDQGGHEREQILMSAMADDPLGADMLLEDQQQQIVLKCVFDTNSPLFMLYTFSVGYLVPALLIIFFYVNVILKLRADAISVRKHSESHLNNANRLHKVTKRIVAVILFYFFCWTPYWALNIMSQFGVIIVSWSTLTLSSVFFAAHLLVCFNSAANPVLYALINRELRQQHAQAFQKRRRSLHLATTNALGFIDKRLSPTQQKSPNRPKDHRVASVGCTEDAHLRLLGNGIMRKLSESGLYLDKRSSSFSHCSSTAVTIGGPSAKWPRLGTLLHQFSGSSSSLGTLPPSRGSIPKNPYHYDYEHHHDHDRQQADEDGTKAEQEEEHYNGRGEHSDGKGRTENGMLPNGGQQQHQRRRKKVEIERYTDEQMLKSVAMADITSGDNDAFL